jgi:hypothetical protein
MIAEASHKPKIDVSTPSAWRVHALALGCYTLLGLIVTFPLVLQLNTGIIGNQSGAVDGFLGIWNVWWAAEALKHARPPFATSLLFYPDGLDLFWQTLSLPQGLLAAPLTLVAGPLVAYNVLIIAGFVLGGYTAFLFARYLTGHTLAALVAGAVYSLAPFHMQKVVDAQLEVAAIQWVPCYLLALHILLERQRWTWALLAGLLLIWVGLGTWYYGLFCLVYTGMATVLWAAAAGARRAAIRCLAWGFAPIAVWLALMAPRLWSLVQTGDQLLGSARRFNTANSADLIGFWLPSPLHPLWGEAITNLYTRLHPTALLWNVSFGLVGIGLALLGVTATWRRSWRWAALLVMTMVLAMGERLQAFGVETGIPLPYTLLAGLPGIRSSHRPNHFVVISIMLVALLASYGARELFRRRPRQHLWIAAGLIAAILAVDGYARRPLVTRSIPPYYATMPPPDGGALLPIPLNLHSARSEHLWYQTVHGWPIVGGFIGREPPYPFARYTPGIRELRYARREAGDIITPGWPDLAREALAAYKIRYVIFHPDMMGQSLPRMRELMRDMGLRTSYRDERTEVYPVPAQERPRPLAFLGAGWNELEGDKARRWRWMGQQAEIRLFNPHGQSRSVSLDLTLESLAHERPLALRLDSTSAGVIQVSRAEMRRRISLLLPPGEHVLYLSAPADPRPGDASQSLSIAFLGIRLVEDKP